MSISAMGRYFYISSALRFTGATGIKLAQKRRYHRNRVTLNDGEITVYSGISRTHLISSHVNSRQVVLNKIPKCSPFRRIRDHQLFFLRGNKKRNIIWMSLTPSGYDRHRCILITSSLLEMSKFIVPPWTTFFLAENWRNSIHTF